MTRPEMNRRLWEMEEALRLEVHRMIYAGYGCHGIVLETHATRKQVNAVFEWRDRYGTLLPTNVAVKE